MQQLLALLDRFVDSGKSIIVMEHNRAVMARTDRIIDLGRAPTRHLLRHGHRRIAMVADLYGLPTSRTRQEGFRQEVRAAGLAAQDRHPGAQ